VTRALDGGRAVERFTTDDLARPLALGPGARRIVSLAPSCTESLLALGAGDRLVGVEEHSELPPALAHLPRIGGFKYLDLARIVALEPDLVVAASLHAVAVVPRLAADGLRVFAFLPRTLDDVVDGLARLAARAAGGGVARRSPGSDRAGGGAHRARGAPAARLRRALPARAHRGAAELRARPGHQGRRRQRGRARARGVAGALGGDGVPPRSRGDRPRGYPGSATAETLAARDGWAGLAAVKTRRVFEVPSPTLKHPGPLAIDGLECVAALLARD
jgi:ABC-type Fe3+-hydroxamate transport system substrate-binding protein